MPTTFRWQRRFDYWYGFESQGYAHFYYPLRMLENKEFIQHPENVGIRKNGYYEQGKEVMLTTFS